MKKRKFLYGTIAFVSVMTVLLIIAGMVFSKSEDEKLNGLTGYFDVSKQGMIAYINYSEGIPEIRLYHPNEARVTRIVGLDSDKMILDPTFSNDGTMITYIVANKNMEEELKSDVYQYNIEAEEKRVLFSASTSITEIAFSPNENSLFYLKAGVFENYSPIASKRPHDFDVYEYKFAEDEHIQHTNIKEYAMSSLNVTTDGKSVFIQMGDESEQTSEDSFHVIERVFEISLDEPEHMKIVSDPHRDTDIWGFTMVPNREEMIFKSVANKDDGGIFQYELYHYDMETNKEMQLTHLKEYATDPVVIPEMNQIYFSVDQQFGQRDADYHLYKMNMDGTDVERIDLPVSED